MHPVPRAVLSFVSALVFSVVVMVTVNAKDAALPLLLYSALLTGVMCWIALDGDTPPTR